MKRRNSGYILAVLIVSLCAHIVYFVSVTTESWLLAEVEDERGVKFYITYGLNKGHISTAGRNRTSKVVLTIVCLVEMNACAWTCLSSNSSNRTSELANLYDSGRLPQPCFQGEQKGNLSVPLCRVQQAFIPATLWLAALVLLLTSGLVSLVALSLTLYNLNYIPSSYWLSIGSLYMWFPASSILSVLALSIWVLMFLLKLKTNLGTVDTIAGYLTSTDNVELGYSMWCQLGVVGLQASCVALLRFRENLFDRRLISSHPSRISHPTYAIDVARI